MRKLGESSFVSCAVGAAYVDIYLQLLPNNRKSRKMCDTYQKNRIHLIGRLFLMTETRRADAMLSAKQCGVASIKVGRFGRV